MITKRETLPDWEFVGGVTQEYDFTLRAENGYYYDIPGATASLAIAPFANQQAAVVVKSGAIIANAAGANCIAHFLLDKNDTVNLHGKFIYQITVKNTDGTIAPPMRGRMFIIENIDKAFVN